MRRFNMLRGVRFLALLLWLALAAPDMAMTVYNGVDANTRSSAMTWGGEINAQTVTADTAEYTLGQEANVILAGSSQGKAFSKWSGDNELIDTPTLNGNTYMFNLAYDSRVNAGAEKKVAGGALSASSSLLAYAKVDNCNMLNYFEGWSKADIDTANTGVGDTYAIVSGQSGIGPGTARYGIWQISPSSNAARQIHGEISVEGSASTVNAESLISPSAKLIPTGKITGAVDVLAMSSADDTMSSSEGNMYISQSSRRGKNGESTIHSYVSGNVLSWAFDGTSPLGIPSSPQDYANVYTKASGVLSQDALAYNYGDSVTSTGSLNSKALHNMAASDNTAAGNGNSNTANSVSTATSNSNSNSNTADNDSSFKSNYNLIINTANTAVTGNRPNYANGPSKTLAHASIDMASFQAASRDNTINKKCSEEDAFLDNLRSEIELVNVWSGNNNQKMTITSERNDLAANVNVDTIINCVGPIQTMDSTDSSKSSASIPLVNAKAISGTKLSTIVLTGHSPSTCIDGADVPIASFQASADESGTTFGYGTVITYARKDNANSVKISYKAFAKS
jgi:hypothetical protein